MIDKIGNGGNGGGTQRLETGRLQGARAGQAAGVAASLDETDKAPASPTAMLAGSGPPVEADRVAALRARIASGGYTIDPDAIAARMMALDLPASA